jgi:hypothetical protein
MERATPGSGQFLTEPDAGQVIDWLLTPAPPVTPATANPAWRGNPT